ncbi:cell division ATP-binding protein FtsE [Agromyces seonyuensis]|uniref:Cell division ATP-binding protein FtsE n=1 Tax=Agromyces seonyuensis TaxID=2662446 RepID=A0A6I4NVW7_9MICO|nr:cell division ATP-binding protein FtsE [Agromyces seonyuensis]MWB98241.1 cell division ATP-binding protein FtsE [Agromyces seonyuensis]
MIRFESVSKSYPGQKLPALDGVDVEIRRGEFVFLVGASGSGKSSFLRLILKEERPTTGEVFVLGQELAKVSSRKVPYFRRAIGVVFQDFRLLQGKTVYDNVAFSLRVIGKSRGFIRSAVPETLKLVGLEGKEKRMPGELSGGEQQRVAIARAIVNKPAILLADEPTGNLDPVTSAGIMALLARINEGGTTIVMATHEAGIVNEMRRRVIELSAGEVVRDEAHAGYHPDAVDALSAAAIAGDESAEAAVPDPDEEAEVDEESTAAVESVATGEIPVAAIPVPVPAAAAPKVEAIDLREAPPLYVEPEATDDVTEEAARITQAATAAVPIQHPSTGATPAIPAAAEAVPELPEHLTLAERLGLRAPGGSKPGDDEQEVGPTR